MSLFWINLLAGIAFIGFGLFSLKDDGSESAEAEAEAEEKAEKELDGKKLSKLSPIIAVATTFFIAELGDKTMLATVVIAGREHNFFWQVWAGSTLGLVLSNALGIVAGKALATKISPRAMRYTVAFIYVISGALAIFEAFKHKA